MVWNYSQVPYDNTMSPKSELMFGLLFPKYNFSFSSASFLGNEVQFLLPWKSSLDYVNWINITFLFLFKEEKENSFARRIVRLEFYFSSWWSLILLWLQVVWFKFLVLSQNCQIEVFLQHHGPWMEKKCNKG